MTRPVIVGPGIVVAADVCAFIGPVLRARLDQAQRNREPVTGDVVETIEAIVRAGEIWRGRSVPKSSEEFRTVDSNGSEAPRWLSVREATEIFESRGRRMTDRAVRKRCESGTLRARKVAGAWRIDPASAKESA